MHFALLAFYILFVVAALVWPTLRLWRREHVNPLVLPSDDSPHGLVGNWFRLVIVGLAAHLAALAFGVPPEVFGRLRWAEAEPVRWIGWALMSVSLVGIVIAQRQMGRSWRIGIDTGAQPPLVQQGVFARSRNPIFLGMRLNLLGLFLVLPNAATLSAVALGEVLMQVQVRLEEEHLRAAFGATYTSYNGVTPRWL